MDDAEADVLAYMGFPAQHRAKIHSTRSPGAAQWRNQTAQRCRGYLPQRGRCHPTDRSIAAGAERCVGGATGTLHDTGNNRAVERCSFRRAADIGGLTAQSTPQTGQPLLHHRVGHDLLEFYLAQIHPVFHAPVWPGSPGACLDWAHKNGAHERRFQPCVMSAASIMAVDRDKHRRLGATSPSSRRAEVRAEVCPDARHGGPGMVLLGGACPLCKLRVFSSRFRLASIVGGWRPVQVSPDHGDRIV